ncbi:LysE family translocator [Stenotrophomonas sp. GD03908]|uniref:LysE family translocator n=1 Tax=Stenotrophomonas maltophilia TaxID=40324 RepID=A0AAJ2TMG6_STEMA|nr:MULTISPECIES: LysE family translocator [Stenotrophomonas]MBH1484229.1 LysE family translocator [Stenotrophomonas maltophilia]MDH0981741.1 LysE family translocator [Stenotrophomonas sp. GD03908]MDQ7292770.1 LysE family translocator [Stenotrophomonas sp. Sm0041]MDZ5763956.1 LysE family translocator [Stenotrophomonas maltophilia]
MDFDTWLLFVASALLLSATPGPNLLHVLDRSVSFGLRRCLFSMGGCLAGVMVLMGVSALGLAALLEVVPSLLGMLRVGGALYLAWLGIDAWRRRQAPLDVGDGGGWVTSSRRLLFRDGFLIGISNPKMLLFTVAFLPPFIDVARPQLPQLQILLATFAVIEVLCYLVFALAARCIAGYLQVPRWRRCFDRGVGSLFIGLGAALLASG